MITISFDGKAMDNAMARFQKQATFAAMVALNRTAGIVKKELQKEMRSVFDRPTPFTMNSLFIKPAKKDSLEAVVWFKTPRDTGEFKRDQSGDHWLKPQVYGGRRPHKNFEDGLSQHGVSRILVRKSSPSLRGWYALPGSAARLNQYGNMSPGQIVQILSAFRAFGEVGYLANRSNRPGARVTGTNRTQYVVVPPGYMRAGKRKPPGVYVRTRTSFKSVLRYVDNVTYRKRFDFFGVAHRTAQREIKSQFDRAIKEALATAR